VQNFQRTALMIVITNFSTARDRRVVVNDYGTQTLYALFGLLQVGLILMY
jgi:hypothetical protein